MYSVHLASSSACTFLFPFFFSLACFLFFFPLFLSVRDVRGFTFCCSATSAIGKARDEPALRGRKRSSTKWVLDSFCAFFSVTAEK